MAWTDKMVEELKSLWQTGLTTSEIAKQLGVSKNSIVGKVHRLSLSGRPSPIKKKEEVQEPVVSKAKKERNIKQPELLVEEPLEKVELIEENIEIIETKAPCEEKNEVSSITRLTDLDNHTCRWPIGDPRDENFHFCGKKIKTGQTYCDEHAAVAYVRR